jgi:MFS family permease
VPRAVVGPTPATRRPASPTLPLVPVLVTAALVSAAIVTLGAPLIFEIQREFGLSEEVAQWSYTVTLLVGASVTPILGRLSDGRWRRSAMTVVCALVALGCAVSAVARSFPLFLAGRALQGLAVALVAMAIATSRDHVSGARGLRLVALLSVTTALGAGASYPVTTAVVERFGLSAAFLGAGALSGLVMVAVVCGVPSTTDPARPRGLDLPGAALLTAGSAIGLLALSLGNRWGWTDDRLLAMTIASAVLLTVWVLLELRIRFPLVNLRLMRERNVLAANVTAVLMGVSLYSLPVLVSRAAVAPESSGYGAGLALAVVGFVLAPVALGNLIGSVLGTLIAARFGPRFSLACGGLVAAAGPILLMTSHDLEVWRLLVAMLVSAFGAGATFATMANLIVVSVAPYETGSATSLNMLLRAVGGATGSAVTAAFLGAHPGVVPGYPSQTGFWFAYLVCAAACLVSVAASLLLPARGTGVRAVVPTVPPG